MLLALLDPLAGLLLATHSMAIKYSSEIYLEAVPMALSLLAVLAFERACEKKPEKNPDFSKKSGFWQSLSWNAWLSLSAIALGAAGAGKYTYLVIVPVIGYMAVSRRAVTWRALLLYAFLALITFWVFNPVLWSDPFNRLRDSLLFHPAYTRSMDVLRAGYPWYQPLEWISNHAPWHPQVFFFPTSDEGVFWLALPGLYLALSPRAGRPRPWVPVWILVAIVTLLLWPTKWPQYTLIMTPPLCLAAAATARWLYRLVKTDNPYWNTIEIMLPRPTRAVWVILAVFVAALVIGRVAYEVQMTQARAGWTQATVDTSPLPSNTVNDIATGRDGTLALATGSGVVLWKPTRNAPWGEAQEPPLYTPATAGLPAARVLAVLQAGDGAWWFGTDEGLARFDAVAWSVYRAGDLKLPGASVHALHQDAAGHIWVGTLSGVARWDGATWAPFTQQPHGLLNNAVFAIASQCDVVWFGSLDGISRFDARSGQWQVFNLGTRALGWRGVTDLTVTADGKLWAATQGGWPGLLGWCGLAVLPHEQFRHPL